MIETTGSKAEEHPCLSERAFEDITNKLEIGIGKRLRDTEHSQREILRLRENVSSRLPTSLEQGCSNSRIDGTRGFSDVSINNVYVINGTRNVSLSKYSSKLSIVFGLAMWSRRGCTVG